MERKWGARKIHGRRRKTRDDYFQAEMKQGAPLPSPTHLQNVALAVLMLSASAVTQPQKPQTQPRQVSGLREKGLGT